MFEMNQQSNDYNVTIMCRVDSSPPSIIKLFDISDDSSSTLAKKLGVTEIRHSVQLTACPAEFMVKCKAGNRIGSTEKNATFKIQCECSNLQHAYGCCLNKLN